MNKYKGYLMITDMDGTLLDSRGNISEENIREVNRFIKEGGYFTLATGRMLKSVEKYLHKIQINAPVILYNGSKIYDYKNEKILYEAFLSSNIKKIIKRVKEEHPFLGIEIYSGEDIYIYNCCESTDRLSKKGYNVYFDIKEQLWHEKWIKILIIGDEKELDYLQNSFSERFGESNLVRSWTRYLEILPDKISKGYALKKLIELLNVNMSEVIAMGDNMNDLEMLSMAGYGFCVENGNSELIKKVKYICSSNENNAVLSVLKYMDSIKAANF